MRKKALLIAFVTCHPCASLFPSLFHLSNGGNSCAKIWETKALRRNNEERRGRKKGVTFGGVEERTDGLALSHELGTPNRLQLGEHNEKGSLSRDVICIMGFC